MNASYLSAAFFEKTKVDDLQTTQQHHKALYGQIAAYFV